NRCGTFRPAFSRRFILIRSTVNGAPTRRLIFPWLPRPAAWWFPAARFHPAAVISKTPLAQKRVSLDSLWQSKQSPYSNATCSFAHAQFFAGTLWLSRQPSGWLHSERFVLRDGFRVSLVRSGGAKGVHRDVVAVCA